MDEARYLQAFFKKLDANKKSQKQFINILNVHKQANPRIANNMQITGNGKQLNTFRSMAAQTNFKTKTKYNLTYNHKQFPNPVLKEYSFKSNDVLFKVQVTQKKKILENASLSYKDQINNQPENNNYNSERPISKDEKIIFQKTYLSKTIEEIPKKLYMRNASQRKQDDIQNIFINRKGKDQFVKAFNEAMEKNKEKETQEHKQIATSATKRKNYTRKKVVQNIKNFKQIEEEERKMKLKLRKQIQLQYIKPFNPPVFVTAAHYIIFEPDFSEHKNKKQTIVGTVNNMRLLRQVKQFKIFKSQLDSKDKKYPHRNKILLSHNSRQSVEVASLTKIMTCILAIQIAQKFKINEQLVQIFIGNFQSNILGTSAQLCQNTVYTLQDLYYGLMLPSGNDASLAIAVWGGSVLLNAEEQQKYEQSNIHKKKECYNRFLQEMNKKAKQIGMQKTNYANSHGLANSENKSCAFDIALLCEYAMKNKKFKEIVSCKQYKAIYYTYKNVAQKSPEEAIKTGPLQNQKHQLKSTNEENDNFIGDDNDCDLDSNENDLNQNDKSLYINKQTITWYKNFIAQAQHPQTTRIKTGITPTAGPCLASCIRSPDNRYFIIVVLSCQKLPNRFRDTQILKKWTYSRENITPPVKEIKSQDTDSVTGLQNLQ